MDAHVAFPITDAGMLNRLPDEALEQLTARYPYFQTARFLLLKRARESRPESFRRQLPLAALYAPRREALYAYVERDDSVWAALRSESVAPETVAPDTGEAIDRFMTLYGPREAREKPVELVYGASADYLATAFSDLGSLEEGEPALAGSDLIDAFLQRSAASGPSRPVAENAPPAVAPLSVASETKRDAAAPNPDTSLSEPGGTVEEESLSESLAKIYIRQKRYGRALEIIKKLSLKYPEKNSYFADQIRFLEKLIIYTKQQ